MRGDTVVPRRDCSRAGRRRSLASLSWSDWYLPLRAGEPAILARDDLLPILGMLHGLAVQIKVLWP